MTTISATDPSLPIEALLDVGAVARLLGCSQRHVAKLVHDHLMPAPLHLGHLRRWRPDIVRDWLEHGCPAQMAERV